MFSVFMVLQVFMMAMQTSLTIWSKLVLVLLHLQDLATEDLQSRVEQLHLKLLTLWLPFWMRCKLIQSLSMVSPAVVQLPLISHSDIQTVAKVASLKLVAQEAGFIL